MIFRARGLTLKGINPAYAKRVLTGMPEDGISIDIAPIPDEHGIGRPNHYGRLKNYGSGTALATKVTYIADEIWVGRERFTIDSAKLAEPLYSTELNCLPIVPSHVEPGQTGELTHLPAFIVKDVDKKITRVEGHFVIECFDVFGNSHQFRQRYHLFTHYADERPTVHVTFSDMM